MPKPKRDKDNIRVGKNIVLIKKACRMTYEEFSDAFGIGESVLTKLQGGTYHLPDEAIAEIALKTQIPFDLIKYEEDLESDEIYQSFKNKYYGKTIKEVYDEQLNSVEGILNVHFPIEADNQSLKSKKFKEAFELISTHKIFEEECLNKAIKLLEGSLKEKATEVVYLDILSCLGRFFLGFCSGVDDKKEDEFKKVESKVAISRFDVLKEFGQLKSDSLANKNRKYYLEQYFDIQEEALEALTDSGKHQDYVQFFHAQEYLLNLFPSDEMNLDESQRFLINTHMTYVMVEMKNKYAISMQKFIEKIYL